MHCLTYFWRGTLTFPPSNLSGEASAPCSLSASSIRRVKTTAQSQSFWSGLHVFVFSGVLLSRVFLLCACDPYQRLNLKSRSGCKRACKRSRNHLTDDITAPWRIVAPAQLNFFSVPLWFTHLFFKISVNVTVHHLRNIFTGF